MFASNVLRRSAIVTVKVLIEGATIAAKHLGQEVLSGYKQQEEPVSATA